MDAATIKLKKKAALLSLVVGFLMFIGKLGAYFLTNSAAILSDALESVVHIVAASFAFYSMMISLKPPSKTHPYGYGKIEFFSAGFEGALIIIAAISIVYYGIADIIKGPEISKLDIGVVIIAIASAVNLGLGFYLIRSGKKTNSLILVADGKHVLTDAVTSVGALIALILILITGFTLFDPIFAILIGLNILYTGFKLIKQAVAGLMNKTETEYIDKIAEALEGARKDHPDWIDIHGLRYWTAGEKFYVDFHLTLPYYLEIEKSHKYMKDLEALFNDLFKTEDVEVLLHIDPCKPTACKICRKEDCNVRQEAFKNEIKWTGDKITGGPSYKT